MTNTFNHLCRQNQQPKLSLGGVVAYWSMTSATEINSSDRLPSRGLS